MSRNALQPVLAGLGSAADVLEGLLESIPPELMKAIRKPGKWSIHCHACHLSVAQPMLLERFRRFMAESEPEFRPYFPDREAGEDALDDMDLAACLASFRKDRGELMRLIATVEDSFWDKRASHPEYVLYTPLIMTRHIMMHDYLHMYRIEELWLTREGYL
jgi:hypothetical protein